MADNSTSSLTTAPEDTYDVIIIGGSFAGLSAAYNVARGRRRVLVVDGGSPRNRFAAHSHGVLGHDGKPPVEILKEARAQLAHYPNCHFITTVVTSIRNVSKTVVGEGSAVAGGAPASKPDASTSTQKKIRPAFILGTSDNRVLQCRRAILTTGLRDSFPSAIDGLQDAWGKGLFHCPYCHGYEFGDKPLGILAMSPMSVHQALMLREWSTDLTFFVGGAADPTSLAPLSLTDEQLARFKKLNVRIETTPVRRVVSTPTGETLSHVELVDGRKVEICGMLCAPKLSHEPNGLIKQLGVQTIPSPLGIDTVKVDPMTVQTSIPGVYAAGDIVRPMNISTGVGDGSQAGAMCHSSLLFEDIEIIESASQ